MIVNYNAGKKRCYDNLLEILKNNNIIYDNLDLKMFCDEFHDFLKNQLFKWIFLNPKDEFLKHLGNILVCDDKTSINLAYLTHKASKEDIKIQTYR